MVVMMVMYVVRYQPMPSLSLLSLLFSHFVDGKERCVDESFRDGFYKRGKQCGK